MIDWNWLWVIGEVGVSYVFFRLWKSNEDITGAIETATQIDIDQLKKQFSSATSIYFAVIDGNARPNDSKSSSVIESSLVPNVFGVIQQLITIEQRRTTNRTINDVIWSVPFQLQSQKGNFVRIEDPLHFRSIANELEVISAKIYQTTNSIAQTCFQALTGNIQTGIELQEKMLVVGAPLTGFGRLEKRAGVWHLVPHEKWNGLLTRSSRVDILSQYKLKSTLFRFISISFLVGAIFTATYLLYRRSKRNLAHRNLIRPTTTIEQETNEISAQHNGQIQCVVCSQNEVTYSVQPCSHLALCDTCAENLRTIDPTEQLCPVCRMPIQVYQRVFVS